MAALPSNLVITCLLMFGGAMLAGSLPMGLQLSSAWLHWVRPVLGSAPQQSGVGSHAFETCAACLELLCAAQRACL